MVEAAAGAQHAPRLLLGLHEGEHALHDRPEPGGGGDGPAESVANPRIEPAHDLDLDRVDQASAVAKVGVHQRPRDPGRLGHLIEGDEERIVLGEEALCSVCDEAAPGVRVEPRCTRSARGWRTCGSGQAEAPATATAVIDSPGARGWWQATK